MPLSEPLEAVFAPKEGSLNAPIGEVLSLLNGAHAQDQAVAMLRACGAGSTVYLVGYTLDRVDIIHELQNAKLRGAIIKVAMDKHQTIHGKTASMRASLLALVGAGVPVRFVEGDNLQAVYHAAGRTVGGGLYGALHAKSLLVDNYALVGSANWTTASRGSLPWSV